MSYYFTAHFWFDISKENAFSILYELSKAKRNHPDKVLQNNSHFFDHEMNILATSAVVRNIFGMPGIWYANQNTLVVISDHLNDYKPFPAEIEPHLTVDFQNGADTDYEYEVWGHHFDDVINQVNGMPLDDLKALVYEDPDDDADYLEEDYLKRAAVYKLVFEKYDFDNFLYNRTAFKAEYFTVSCINDMDDTYDILMAIHKSGQPWDLLDCILATLNKNG